jgi:hypothetical protein
MRRACLLFRRYWERPPEPDHYGCGVCCQSGTNERSRARGLGEPSIDRSIPRRSRMGTASPSPVVPGSRGVDLGPIGAGSGALVGAPASQICAAAAPTHRVVTTTHTERQQHQLQRLRARNGNRGAISSGEVVQLLAIC